MTEMLRISEGARREGALAGLPIAGEVPRPRRVYVETWGPYRYLSLAAMLIPTNDAFVALNGVRPRFQSTYNALAYDAGTEANDEACASIPGPDFVECGGPGGGGDPGGGEGYVFVHAGMHGVGDMNEAERDWRNPVARIQVQRVMVADDDDDSDDEDSDD